MVDELIHVETIDLPIDLDADEPSFDTVCRAILDGAIRQMYDNDITECIGSAQVGPVKITLMLKVEKLDG